MSKGKKLLTLFLTFFKIGLFTFGGGHAMIALLEQEFVGKKKWVTSEDFLNIVSIAESTPGPVAINSATFIGHRVAGVLGSVLCTLGVVLPSFIIIYIISLFFDAFRSIELVAHAFRGINAAVAFLIISAGFRMMKKLKKNAFNAVLLPVVFVVMTTLSILGIAFSSIYYVLIGATLGIISWAICAKGKKEASND